MIISKLYEQAISSTSWKLTKPLRNMKDSVMEKNKYETE